MDTRAHPARGAPYAATALTLLLAACVHQRPSWDGPVAGTVALESVVRVVEAKRVSIQSCYQAGIPGGSGLAAGLVIVEFIIDPDGRVRDLRVVQRSGPSSLSHCVEDVLVRAEFDRPEGGAVGVRYPLRWEIVEAIDPVPRERAAREPSLWHRR